jgi:hypothetical protein
MEKPAFSTIFLGFSGIFGQICLFLAVFTGFCGIFASFFVINGDFPDSTEAA